MPQSEVWIDQVLRASTAHMPDLHEDISYWLFGTLPLGEPVDWEEAWVYAYDDNDLFSPEGKPLPDWLLNLCVVARKHYGCNWVHLSGDGCEVPDLPVYEHK